MFQSEIPRVSIKDRRLSFFSDNEEDFLVVHAIVIILVMLVGLDLILNRIAGSVTRVCHPTCERERGRGVTSRRSAVSLWEQPRRRAAAEENSNHGVTRRR